MPAITTKINPTKGGYRARFTFGSLTSFTPEFDTPQEALKRATEVLTELAQGMKS